MSVDGDFSSELVATSPNSFLAAEYHEKKNAGLYLYRSLLAFFGVHFPHIKLASDIAKVKAIDDLAKSGSFWATHVAIPALNEYISDFTKQDIEKLTEIAETNSQVGWIIEDPDVSGFYTSLAESKEIGEELKQRNWYLFPEDSNEQPDDIPPF